MTSDRVSTCNWPRGTCLRIANCIPYYAHDASDGVTCTLRADSEMSTRVSEFGKIVAFVRR